MLSVVATFSLAYYESRKPRTELMVENATIAPSSPPLPPTTVLAYHGDYSRNDGQCSDFFAAAHNQKTQVVEPLRRLNHRVLTAFDTVRSPCAARDAALVSFLSPIMHQFRDERSARIVDSYLRVMDIVRRSGVAYDNLILLRFDLMFRVPLSKLSIDWNLANFAFRDDAGFWASKRLVSDLLFIFPRARFDDMRSAIDASGNVPQEPNARVLGGGRTLKGSGHFTWRIYDERHGGTHFMHEGHSTSYLNGKHCEAPNGLGMPVYILRECPAKHGDVCDPVLSECARSGAAQLGMRMRDGFSS